MVSIKNGSEGPVSSHEGPDIARESMGKQICCSWPWMRPLRAREGHGKAMGPNGPRCLGSSNPREWKVIYKDFHHPLSDLYGFISYMKEFTRKTGIHNLEIFIQNWTQHTKVTGTPHSWSKWESRIEPETMAQKKNHPKGLDMVDPHSSMPESWNATLKYEQAAAFFWYCEHPNDPGIQSRAAMQDTQQWTQSTQSHVSQVPSLGCPWIGSALNTIQDYPLVCGFNPLKIIFLYIQIILLDRDENSKEIAPAATFSRLFPSIRSRNRSSLMPSSARAKTVGHRRCPWAEDVMPPAAKIHQNTTGMYQSGWFHHLSKSKVITQI